MPYTFRQGDLPKLDLEVDKGSDFKAWTVQWDDYRTLSGLSDEGTSKQASVLRMCFSRETLTTVDNLGLTQDQMNDPVAIIKALRHHVEGQINVTVERRNFRKRKQQLGETFDDFLCSLRDLAKTCRFCNDTCAQDNIRDQIIEGLADSDTVQELLKEQNLTLPNTITTCRGMEAAKKEVTSMKGIRPEDQPQEERCQVRNCTETKAVFTNQREHHAELLASEPTQVQWLRERLSRRGTPQLSRQKLGVPLMWTEGPH